MDTVRIGIVGYGTMGNIHAAYLAAGEIPAARLTAVADAAPERLDAAGQLFGSDVRLFATAQELFTSGTVDGVIVAVPHYDHPRLATAALGCGLHVLVEKPSGVYTRQVRQMNDAADRSDRVFGLMFNQRIDPVNRKVKDLLDGGELGELKRMNWIITNWYRSQSYFDSGSWRATWKGEGGGVLLNQSPHQLDLWQWFFGLPSRIRAFAAFGKWHEIEVEDDVTAYLEYRDGPSGVFITSTGDAPGTNRLEISGDRGRLVVENGALTFWRNRIPERQFNRESRGGFGAPEFWKCDIPVEGVDPQHQGITANWVDAIRNGTPLIAPGQEGLYGLMLANAMLLSAWSDGWVDIPIDDDRYYELLQEKIRTSGSMKREGTRTLDATDSFGSS